MKNFASVGKTDGVVMLCLTPPRAAVACDGGGVQACGLHTLHISTSPALSVRFQKRSEVPHRIRNEKQAVVCGSYGKKYKPAGKREKAKLTRQ